MQSNIEIPLNKGKLIWLFVGWILGLVASIWLYNFAETQTQYPPTLLKSVGGICFAFFGVMGLFLSKKIFDTKSGISINDKGIVENTNGVSVHLVAWKDIQSFESLKTHGQQLILIKVKNAEKYIEKATNNAQKRLLRLNAKEYGTPIFITTNSLKMDFEALWCLQQMELKKRKK